MSARASVLIVDDDPQHLKIYSWIVEAAGYRAVPVVVGFTGVDLPADLSEHPADVVLLDYNLAGGTTATGIAQLIRSRLPNAPVILLSDVQEMPEDIAPLVEGFVRKGDPAKLIARLRRLLPAAS